MTATCVYIEHVLNPQKRRMDSIIPGRSIADLNPAWDMPYIALLDGRPVLRKDWNLIVNDGQVLAFVDVRAMPQGGGGGSKNPMRTIAMIAVMVVAPMIGKAVAGAMFTAGTTAFSFASGAVTAGAMFGGMALVNALLPAPTMQLSNLKQQEMASPSPTYNLQAQGNQARIDAAIPEHFGRHIVWPDLAAIPYQEYQGQEQYLFQLMCIGRGSYDIEQIKIEDTPIGNFQEIEYEVVPPHGELTLFPANVITATEVSGQDMPFEEYIGPFIASPPGTESNYIGIDFVAPRGLYEVRPSGNLRDVAVMVRVEAREIDDEGDPVGGGDYTVLGEHIYSAATPTPRRYSERYAVPAGRYEVRVRRDDEKQTGTEFAHDINWAGMRAYLQDTDDYGDCTLIAMKMLASSQLSQYATRRVNLIATRKLPATVPVRLFFDGDGDYVNCGDASLFNFTGDFSVSFDFMAVGVSSTFARIVSRGVFDTAGWEIIARANIDRLTLNIYYDDTAYYYTFNDVGLHTWQNYRFELKSGVVSLYINNYFFHSHNAETPDSYAGDLVFGGRSHDPGANNIHGYLGNVKLRNASGSLVGYWPMNEGSGSVVYDRVGNNHGQITGATWPESGPTRSLARALAYICRQVGWEDKHIDLPALTALESTLAERGDYFDARFDNFLTAWEALQRAAQSARTKPFIQAGFVRFHRVQPQTAPVAMFGPRNIVKGSFSIEYLMPTQDTADKVDVNYFDKDVWAYRTVPAKLPGSDALKPSKMELFGVVERDHAFREGMYQAAANRYQRKIIRFQTEMEGFIPSYGDLVGVSHDLPAWGQSGDVLEWDEASLTIVLSEPLTWKEDALHYIAFRKSDGTLDGPYPVTKALEPGRYVDDGYVQDGYYFSYEAGTVILADAPATAINTDLTVRERTQYYFGWGQTLYQEAIVLAARPMGGDGNLVEIQAVNEDPSVHTAETGEVAPPVNASQLPPPTASPTIRGIMLRSKPGDPTRIMVSWEPSPWADWYLIEMSADGQTWTRVGDTGANNWTGPALYGNATIIRIAAIGAVAGGRGPWSIAYYSDSSDFMWDADDAVLMWDADDSTLMWTI